MPPDKIENGVERIVRLEVQMEGLREQHKEQALQIKHELEAVRMDVQELLQVAGKGKFIGALMWGLFIAVGGTIATMIWGGNR